MSYTMALPPGRAESVNLTLGTVAFKPLPQLDPAQFSQGFVSVVGNMQIPDQRTRPRGRIAIERIYLPRGVHITQTTGTLATQATVDLEAWVRSQPLWTHSEVLSLTPISATEAYANGIISDDLVNSVEVGREDVAEIFYRLSVNQTVNSIDLWTGATVNGGPGPAATASPGTAWFDVVDD